MFYFLISTMDSTYSKYKVSLVLVASPFVKMLSVCPLGYPCRCELSVLRGIIQATGPVKCWLCPPFLPLSSIYICCTVTFQWAVWMQKMDLSFFWPFSIHREFFNIAILGWCIHSKIILMPNILSSLGACPVGAQKLVQYSYNEWRH